MVACRVRVSLGKGRVVDDVFDVVGGRVNSDNSVLSSEERKAVFY